eukprot:6137133-Prorocentrum_lima.AAC.1
MQVHGQRGKASTHSIEFCGEPKQLSWSRLEDCGRDPKIRRHAGKPTQTGDGCKEQKQAEGQEASVSHFESQKKKRSAFFLWQPQGSNSRDESVPRKPHQHRRMAKM